MTYANHCYLHVVGDTQDGGNTVEEWSFGVRFGAPGSTLTNSASDSQNDDIAGALSAFWNAVKGNYPPSRRLTGFKWNNIKSDGLYETPENPNTYEFTTPLAGTSGGTTLPLQVAMTASLRTGLAGKRYNGRLYLPAPAQALAGLYWSEDYRPTMQTAVATLLTNLNVITDAANGVVACVISSRGTPGPVNAITGVTIGRVPDTIRRRRNKLTENYPTPTAVNSTP